LGNPYELTWIDYKDDRGFHLFDLHTNELKFYKNPNSMFHKIYYNDKEQSDDDIVNKNLSLYTNTYVKVVVENKTNPFLFDKFLNNLYNVGPIDINIVEDFTESLESDVTDDIDQAEDTLSIIYKYIDGIENDSVDTAKLKTVMRRLYADAINQEEV
jgi:hypothetical protein